MNPRMRKEQKRINRVLLEIFLALMAKKSSRDMCVGVLVCPILFQLNPLRRAISKIVFKNGILQLLFDVLYKKYHPKIFLFCIL